MEQILQVVVQVVVPGEVVDVGVAETAKVEVLVAPDTSDERALLLDPVVLVDQGEGSGLVLEGVVGRWGGRREVEHREDGEEGEDGEEHCEMLKMSGGGRGFEGGKVGWREI